MKFFLLLLLLPQHSAFADPNVDACLTAWKNAPFKKGTEPHHVVGSQVKVFGIGKKDFEDSPTDKPRLILIKPSVNVLGKTSFRLMNPNGWYCFRANVSVLGKMNIQAVCGAKLASSKEDGTSVLGSDESDKGVAVLGSLRVTRIGDCGAGAGVSRKEGEVMEENIDEDEGKKEKAPKVVTVTTTFTATGTTTK